MLIIMIPFIAAVVGVLVALCWRMFIDSPIFSEEIGGLAVAALVCYCMAYAFEQKNLNAQLTNKLKAAQERLDNEMNLQELCPTTWHRDEAMWFHFVLQRWYHNCGRGEGSLSDFLQNTLNNVLKCLEGVSVIKSLRIHHLDLGARPPIVERVVPHRVAAKDQVFLDIHLHWPSEAAATAGLELAGIGSAAVIAIKLNQIQFSCVMRLGLTLNSTFPACLTDMSIAFVKSPDLDFAVQILKAVNLSGLPSIDSLILKLVQNAIKNCMVWPARIIIPFGEPEPVDTLPTPNPFESEQSLRSLDGDGLSAQASNRSVNSVEGAPLFVPMPPCKGIIMINLLCAEDLIAADSNGLSDPYAILTLENDQRASSVVNKSLNPTWRERFRWLIKDPSTAVLRLELFDEDATALDMLTFSGDDPLGMAQVGVWEVKDKVLELEAQRKAKKEQSKEGATVDEAERWEKWLELDEVDKGRVKLKMYYADLVPLVPLNGAPLDKEQTDAVRRAFATKPPPEVIHTDADVLMGNPGDLTAAARIHQHAAAKKAARKLSAKVRNQSEARQIRAAAQRVAVGEDEVKEGDSADHVDAELMTSIQKSMSGRADLRPDIDAKPEGAHVAGSADAVRAGTPIASSAPSPPKDLVVVAVMVQLLECKDLRPAGQLAVHARHPYVNFKLRDQTFKSTCGETLHPTWDKEPQAFHFYTRLDAAELVLSRQCERLKVEVKDHHHLHANEILGTTEIPLDGSKVGDVWIPLTEDGYTASNHDGYHAGTDATCGSVRLRIVPLAVPAHTSRILLRGQTQSGKAAVGGKKKTGKVATPTGPERVRRQEAAGDTPKWVKDDEAPECMQCEKTFSTMSWRHHCRWCKCVFCDGCAPFRKTGVPLSWHNDDPKPRRVCNSCYDYLAVQANVGQPGTPRSELGATYEAASTLRQPVN